MSNINYLSSNVFNEQVMKDFRINENYGKSISLKECVDCKFISTKYKTCDCGCKDSFCESCVKKRQCYYNNDRWDSKCDGMVFCKRCAFDALQRCKECNQLICNFCFGIQCYVCKNLSCIGCCKIYDDDNDHNNKPICNTCYLEHAKTC